MTVSSSRTRKTVATLFSICFILSTAAGYGKANWWICDMLANLRAHAALALLIMVPVHFYFGQRLLMWVVAAVLATTVATSVAGFPVAPSSAELQSQELTVVSYNLGHGQVNPSGLDKYIDDTDADVIVFQEYSHDWHKYLERLEKQYPYYVSEPRADPFGIAVFSRLPLLDSAAEEFTDSNIPFISATVLFDDRKITLLGVHMDWPIQFSTFATRNGQIEDVIAVLDASENPVIVCGDWNLTPWSGWYRKIIAAGLHDAGLADRIAPTWPSGLAMLGIPIDHCFASKGLWLHAKTVGPMLESDHRPIAVTVRFHRGN